MKRTTITSLIVTFAVFCAGSLSAAAQSSNWSGTCAIRFSGKSTLHNFDGKVSAEPFSVQISNPSDLASATASGKVTVKAAKMDTGNKKRDIEMRKCLDVDSYPEIVVTTGELTLNDTKPKSEGGAPRPTIIPFTLALKGKTHHLNASITNWSVTDSEIHCSIAFPVSLSAAGIKPPSVMGLVKVKDEIEVEADLVLKKS